MGNEQSVSQDANRERYFHTGSSDLAASNLALPAIATAHVSPSSPSSSASSAAAAASRSRPPLLTPRFVTPPPVPKPASMLATDSNLHAPVTFAKPAAATTRPRASSSAAATSRQAHAAATTNNRSPSSAIRKNTVQRSPRATLTRTPLSPLSTNQRVLGSNTRMITKQSLEHVDKTHQQQQQQQQQQLVSPSAASSATDDFMWKIRSPSHYRKPARTIYLYRDPDFHTLAQQMEGEGNRFILNDDL